MRTSYAIVAIIVVGLLAGTAGYAVTTLTASPSSQKISGLSGPIKIGVLMPLSGQLAGPGKGMTDAIQLAAMVANESGGLGGHYIKLYIDDVQTDPQLALTSLQTLYSTDGVQVVIGPPTTQQVLTVEKYINSSNIVLITPSATAGALSGSSPYFFRTVVTDNLQAQAIAAYINAKGYQRVAISERNDALGQGITNSLKTILGSKIVTSILMQSGQTDYTTEMQQIKSANPDVIVYGQFVQDGIIMFHDAVNLGLQNIPTIGTEELDDPSFFQDSTAAHYMAETNLTGPTPISSTGTPAYVNFANLFNQTFGFQPGLFTAQCYDATMIAIQAIARAGSYNGTLIRQEVVPVSQNYIGPAGYLAMNNQGDITQVSWSYYRVASNSTGYNFQIVGSYSPATGVSLSSP